MFLQLYWSQSVVNSMTGHDFKQYTPVYIKSPLMTNSRGKTPLRSEEVTPELRDRIVLRHRPGDGYRNKFCCIEASKENQREQWPVLLFNGRSLEEPGLFTKLSNQGRRTLVRWPRTQWWLWLSSRELPEGHPSLQHSNNLYGRVVI